MNNIHNSNTTLKHPQSLNRQHQIHSRTVIKTGVQSYAYWAGFFMLFTALFALIMPGSRESLPALNVDISYGLFMGILPANIINKLVLITFGITGVISAKKISSAKKWSIIVFFTMMPLAVIGLFDVTDTMFGFAPLFGTQVFTYTLFAVLGAYFGYKKTL